MKPRRHVGDWNYWIGKKSELKCGNLEIRMQFKIMHFDWRLSTHTHNSLASMRKFTALRYSKIVYLQHGSGNNCRQSDVTVTTALLLWDVSFHGRKSCMALGCRCTGTRCRQRTFSCCTHVSASLFTLLPSGWRSSWHRSVTSLSGASRDNRWPRVAGQWTARYALTTFQKHNIIGTVWAPRRSCVSFCK